MYLINIVGSKLNAVAVQHFHPLSSDMSCYPNSHYLPSNFKDTYTCTPFHFLLLSFFSSFFLIVTVVIPHFFSPFLSRLHPATPPLSGSFFPSLPHTRPSPLLSWEYRFITVWWYQMIALSQLEQWLCTGPGTHTHACTHMRARFQFLRALTDSAVWCHPHLLLHLFFIFFFLFIFFSSFTSLCPICHSWSALAFIYLCSCHKTTSEWYLRKASIQYRKKIESQFSSGDNDRCGMMTCLMLLICFLFFSRFDRALYDDVLKLRESLTPLNALEISQE